MITMDNVDVSRNGSKFKTVCNPSVRLCVIRNTKISDARYFIGKTPSQLTSGPTKQKIAIPRK